MGKSKITEKSVKTPEFAAATKSLIAAIKAKDSLLIDAALENLKRIVNG